jgi:tetratricopeptide (TPR) repeat protein
LNVGWPAPGAEAEMRHLAARSSLVAMLPLLPFTCGVACAQVLDFPAIEAMIKRGEFTQAYALLDPHEVKYAGDADFDYLFGIAALESGHPARSRAALERLLLVNPELVGARLNLARAYAALGDKPRARSEFSLVLAANPPQATRDAVARYLATLDSHAAIESRSRVAGYLETALGRDTNINLATGSSEVYVPLFGINFTLPPASVALRDNYASVAAGAAIEHPLDEHFTAFGIASAKLRDNQHTSLYNSEEVEVRAGMQYAEGARLGRLGLIADRYNLDHQGYRNITGALGEWRLQLDENNQASVFAQDSRIRYLQSAASSFSGEQTLLGAGWLRNFDAAARNYIFAGAYGGRDRATEQRDDGDKAILGMRVAVQWSAGASSEWFGFASAANGRYRDLNPNFLVTRNDRQYDAGFGLNWRPAPDWSLRPQLAYTRNSSNIELYDYNRYDLSITLRRDFR